MMNFETWWNDESLRLKMLAKKKWIDENKDNEAWEPNGGIYFVDNEGMIDKHDESHFFTREFGVERTTLEIAERASEKMRKHNRLLAYVDEACGGYEFISGVDNYYIYINRNAYSVGISTYHNAPSGVYMPYEVAKELCEKLNNGEVVL